MVAHRPVINFRVSARRWGSLPSASTAGSMRPTAQREAASPPVTSLKSIRAPVHRSALSRPNLTCPNGLSVDPLSGDLFFDDECFGAGSDNPSIWRIHDPAGAATMSVYATLPASPGGQLAFSPDGALYAVAGYNNIQQVVKIGGTNTPSPASMTTLAGITSFFCLTMGEAQGSGAAKSLIVCDSNGIELIDVTTNPFTPSTVLISSGTAGSGVRLVPTAAYTPSGQRHESLNSRRATGGCVASSPRIRPRRWR